MKYLILTGCLFLVGAMYGQKISPNLISGSGGFYKDQNVSVHWSVGEVAVSEHKNSQIYLTEGFHQGRIFITAISQVPDWDILIYPNPAGENFYISSERTKILNIQIFDIKGMSVLNTVEMSGIIDVSKLNPGNYIVRLKDDKSRYSMYKLIKQ